MSRPRILMLTHRIPYPPDRGDRIRSLNMLSEFSKRWDVWLACTNDEPIEPSQLDYLQTLCCDVTTATCLGPDRWLRAVRFAAVGRSLTEGLFCSDSLKKDVAAWQSQVGFDAVFCYCSSMFPYVQLLPKHLPVVVDLVDVDSQKWAEHKLASRSWKRPVYAMESSRVARLEQLASDRASCVTLVSDQEVDSFREFVDDSVASLAIGNGVDVDYFSPVSLDSENDVAEIAFVGVLDYGPNVEGISWFVKSVLPRIQTSKPARLSIVGRRATADVKRLAQADGVEVFSDVDDVRPYIRQSDVMVAPLRIARGIQNKVLEAMACGRAVVATSAAAEGVEAAHGEELLVADCPDEFAKHVVALLADSTMRATIGTAARRLVETKYTWAARLDPMVQLMSKLISQGKPEAAAL